MGVADGAIGGMLGLFGNIIDSGNVSATNEANRWMNIITNQTNERINEAQLAWAREQYEREQAENRYLMDLQYSRDLENRSHNEEYNSPQALMERYRQAGLNPYLMMSQGHLGSASGGSSMSGYNASNPHANQPNMIPAQNGAPEQAYTGFGMGIRDSMRTALEFMNNERQDYALASQIDVQFMNARANMMQAAAAAKEAGVNEKWIEHQIEDSDRNFFLNQDKFAAGVDEFRTNAAIASREQAVQEFNAFLNWLQTQENIRLSAAQRGAVSQSIQESIARVNNMAHSEILDEAEYNQKIVQTAIENIRNEKQLGIDEQLAESSIFRNYVDTATSFLGAGLGTFFGMRGFRIANAVGRAGNKVARKFEKTMSKYNKQYRKNVVLKKNQEYHTNFGFDND